MWIYEKKLQHPVNIKKRNPAFAKLIITQYGGPDGELGASLRYLSQRFVMPVNEGKAVLTDIGTSVPILRIRGIHAPFWLVLADFHPNFVAGWEVFMLGRF